MDGCLASLVSMYYAHLCAILRFATDSRFFAGTVLDSDELLGLPVVGFLASAAHMLDLSAMQVQLVTPLHPLSVLLLLEFTALNLRRLV